jgi:hypothetical protein
MTDSRDNDALAAKHARNREQRITAIKRWVEYIKTHDAEVWGKQQNRLVNSQIEAARQSDIDLELRERVDRDRRDRSR